MKAMPLTDICGMNTTSRPLSAVEGPVPVPAADEILIKSVANVTRSDVRDYLALAAEIPIVPGVREFEPADANLALRELKQGRIKAARVIRLDA